MDPNQKCADFTALQKKKQSKLFLLGAVTKEYRRQEGQKRIKIEEFKSLFISHTSFMLLKANPLRLTLKNVVYEVCLILNRNN